MVVLRDENMRTFLCLEPSFASFIRSSLSSRTVRKYSGSSISGFREYR